MPFLLGGIVVLLAAGGVALYMQRSADKAPGAGPVLGATKREPDPPAAPVTTFQTTSGVEPSDGTFSDRANESPDKFNSSGAATFSPVGGNVPEDPFLAMAAVPAGDRPLGYAVDDMGDAPNPSPFDDDITRPADLAFAPAVSSGGVPPASLAGN